VSVGKDSGGLKYLGLTVKKTPRHGVLPNQVELSSDPVDCFSGDRHATILVDSAALLRVRDNTPVSGSEKRYIRLR
jgi:hypothetical protein